VHAIDGIRWARRSVDIEVLGVVPRYLPSWASVLMRVPVLREVASWNVMIISRRRDTQPGDTRRIDP